MGAVAETRRKVIVPWGGPAVSRPAGTASRAVRARPVRARPVRPAADSAGRARDARTALSARTAGPPGRRAAGAGQSVFESVVGVSCQRGSFSHSALRSWAVSMARVASWREA